MSGINHPTHKSPTELAEEIFTEQNPKVQTEHPWIEALLKEAIDRDRDQPQRIEQETNELLQSLMPYYDTELLSEDPHLEWSFFYLCTSSKSQTCIFDNNSSDDDLCLLCGDQRPMGHS